ncbi:7921_t:CDS:2, partial [Scutellospora calospora]
LYAGWFGPIGIGAVFYAAIAKEDGTDNVRKLVNPVLISVFCHGISVPVIKIGKTVNSLSRTATGQSILNYVGTTTTIIIGDEKKKEKQQETSEDTTVKNENNNVDKIIMVKETESDKTTEVVDDNNKSEDIKDMGDNNSIDSVKEQTLPVAANVKFVEEDLCEKRKNVEDDGSHQVYVTPNPP